MRNYIYLAHDRIKTIYDDICNNKQIEYAIGANLDFKIAGASYERIIKTNNNSTVEKLSYILSDFSKSDSSKSKNCLNLCIPMAWTILHYADIDGDPTMWCAKIPCSGHDNYNYEMILLIGSAHNIVGNHNSANLKLSTSNWASFVWTLAEIANKLCSNEDNKPSRVKNNSPKWLLDERKTEKLINTIYDLFPGEYGMYEFYAQIINSFTVNDTSFGNVKYIIAAPLFVSKRQFFGERVSSINGRKMYTITRPEFDKHRIDGFRHISLLLSEKHLYYESEMFESEMQSLCNSVGGKKLFSDPVLFKQFVKDAEPIVLKYFRIYGESV